MTKQEIKTKLKNINSKLKKLLNEMNSDAKDIDKLFDCIQVISLKYELSQKPLILKKECEIKNEEEDLERALDFKINKWGFETKNN